jgi:hypothetical protein
MNATSNPQTAAERAGNNYRDVTSPDAAVPEAVRDMAEKAVDQSREVNDLMLSTHRLRPLRGPWTLPGKAPWRSTARSSISLSGM